MATCNVIIGANYGDSGKGRVTDALATSDTLVVRFNGGCQAGHTVVTDKLRHTFHHFGSGTLKGAATFLSKYFIINPIMFRKEWEELEKKGITPVVYADPRCMVTTPFDMIINQTLERSRRDRKHGSCGLGINETIERHLYKKAHFDSGPFATSLELLFCMLRDGMGIEECLKLNIQQMYLPQRCLELGITIPQNWMETVPAIIDHYIEDVEFLLGRVDINLWSPNKIRLLFLLPDSPYRIDSLLFEGAQGLGLDQDNPNFPHVTRSNTGLTNVMALLKEIGYVGDVNVYYVTRPYITRHGAGPLLHEESNMPKLRFMRIEDETNITNEWQGPLRFGWMDLGRFTVDIERDRGRINPPRDIAINPTTNLVITCVDQLDQWDRIKFYEANRERIGSIYMLIDYIQDRLHFSSVVLSRSAQSESPLVTLALPPSASRYSSYLGKR